MYCNTVRDFQRIAPTLPCSEQQSISEMNVSDPADPFKEDASIPFLMNNRKSTLKSITDCNGVDGIQLSKGKLFLIGGWLWVRNMKNCDQQ